MTTLGQIQRQLAGARGQGYGGLASTSDFDRARLRSALIQSGCSIPIAPGRGSSRTICVRVCDGYYFPISNGARRSRYATDAAVCQSMYSAEGQAELFVQPSGADVKRAVSLSGERYADQEYAFGYREAYDPACHSQLKTGIIALAERYRNAPPMTKPGKILPTISTTQPSDSVEGLDAIEVSSVAVPKEDQGEAVPSIEATRPVRLVGDAYYSKLFDLIRPEPAKHERKSRRSGTGHSVPVDTAVTDAAAQNAGSATLVSIPGLPLSSGTFVRSQEMPEVRIDYIVDAVSGYLGYHWLASTLGELLP